VYDEPHRDYLYTEAFVDKLLEETSTATRTAPRRAHAIPRWAVQRSAA
jgi:hypothetical protein